MRRLADRAWWHASLLPLVVLVFVCLVGGGVAGGYFVTRNLNDVTTLTRAVADACDRQNQDRAALRRVLTFAQAFSLADPALGSADKARVTAFYAGAKKLIPLVDCGRIAATN